MPTAAKKPVYVAVIKMDDTYAVVLTRGGTAVEGFSTEAEGLAYFENAYRRAHVRSIEASTAAMISWLMMAPAIVEVADATVIQRWVDFLTPRMTSDQTHEVVAFIPLNLWT